MRNKKLTGYLFWPGHLGTFCKRKHGKPTKAEKKLMKKLLRNSKLALRGGWYE